MSNVEYRTGDMLTSTALAYGHGVNIQAKMGAGIAKIIRQKYPEIYKPYATACIDGTLTVGNMLPILTSNGKWILNLVTQDRIGGKFARLEWVKSSLIQAFDFCKSNDIDRFALPRIGSGLGGLSWDKVKTIIEEVAESFPEVKLEVWSLPVKLIAINKK